MALGQLFDLNFKRFEAQFRISNNHLETNRCWRSETCLQTLTVIMCHSAYTAVYSCMDRYNYEGNSGTSLELMTPAAHSQKLYHQYENHYRLCAALSL